MKPERRVEKRLHDGVRDRGGLCVKLAPTTAGVPDRLVILPPGQLSLVELKAPGGRIRPIQAVLHKRLAQMGVTVHILSSVDEVDRWLSSMI